MSASCTVSHRNQAWFTSHPITFHRINPLTHTRTRTIPPVQALEELEVLNERLVTEHTLLQESFATFLEGAEKGAATQDAALAHITERSQELAAKLAAAEVRSGDATQAKQLMGSGVGALWRVQSGHGPCCGTCSLRLAALPSLTRAPCPSPPPPATTHRPPPFPPSPG
jgi:hypothetical protein